MLDPSTVPSTPRAQCRVPVIRKWAINRIHLRTRLSRRNRRSISLLAVRPKLLGSVAFANACHRVPLLNISQPFSPHYPSFYASAYPESYWDEAPPRSIRYAHYLQRSHTLKSLPPSGRQTAQHFCTLLVACPGCSLVRLLM